MKGYNLSKQEEHVDTLSKSIYALNYINAKLLVKSAVKLADFTSPGTEHTKIVLFILAAVEIFWNAVYAAEPTPEWQCFGTEAFKDRCKILTQYL